MAKSKGPKEEEDLEEEPQALLDIARRARVLAGALPDPDKSRILRYVQKLEKEVMAMTARDARRKQRLADKPSRSPKAPRSKPRA